MIRYLYILALSISLAGMGIIDWRFKLALFTERRRSLLTIGAAVGLFCLWDIAGIMLNIFFTGTSPYITGWYLGPDFPIEELFFLTLFTYTTLIIWRVMERLCRHT